MLRYFSSQALLLSALFIAGLLCASAESARLRRAVWMNLDTPNDCIPDSLMKRNSSSTVILTATVRSCEEARNSMYTCTVQVWTVMKGKSIVWNLMQLREEKVLGTVYTKVSVEISGFGNKTFCESEEVKESKTRIFFLNKVDGRLVVAAATLHISLKNLENTEKVIEGIKVEEEPRKPQDPCLSVLCGFGSTCQASTNGTATCVCPKVTCGKTTDSSDIYAPVCGSNGVTYPNECRLKAAQCWSQRRIRIKSRLPCAPVRKKNPCEEVECGNSAECMVEDGVAKCQCSSCDDAVTIPVCGSNQMTYRSECDLKRAACTKAQSIQVMRRASCEPCMVYNKTTEEFDKVCSGVCSLNSDRETQCCDDIPCGSFSSIMICGSDGRTYMSRCAMERYACKSGKDIVEVSAGSCPSGKNSTVIRGSASIMADDRCPGNCQSSSPAFIAFKDSFEQAVIENLEKKNRGDVRTITDFKIEEVRNGSVIFVYSARITWLDKPIDKDFTPGEDSMWAYQRLHDPNNGVFVQVINSFAVSPSNAHDPSDDFITEEICGTMQCSHSASCKLSRDESGGFLYDCDCSVIGDSNRLPVTLGCKMANNKHFYDNKISVKRASCITQSFLTFTDICKDPPPNPCDDVNCDAGSSCIITDGRTSCECITCDDELSLVCGSNGKTYRSHCELNRENCLLKTEVTIKNEGMCVSQCDNVNCSHGSQCEELPHKVALCICPSNCINANVPVCGSDGVTYDNDCEMVVASCQKKMEITVLHRSPCDGTEITTFPVIPTEEPEGSGSGEMDCGCMFGATCDATADDEDERCVCHIKCESSVKKVCGSDGVTYASDCELEKARCEKQHHVIVVHQGACSETCNCNEHGSFSPICDSMTGQCVCRPGVGGKHCDKCLPGYWNFRAVISKTSIGCMRCQCERNGSVRDDCDLMTGQCTCKQGVVGVKCSTCENGAKLSKDGCVEELSAQTANSCEELHCTFGKECIKVDDGSNLYECKCPQTSMCNSYPRKKVCGSNGVTYASECDMRIAACREGNEVLSLSDQSCSEHFESMSPSFKPSSSTSPKTTSPMTTASTSTFSTTESSVIPMSTTQFTPVAVTTMEAVPGMIGSGGTTDFPPDDEEVMSEYSGEGEEETTTPMTTTTSSIIANVTTYKVEATFVTAEGTDLVYSNDLINTNPELYAQYVSSITGKIEKIFEMDPSDNVALSSLKNIVLSNSKGKGVFVTMEMEVASSMPGWKIENLITRNLEDGEIFAISGKVVKPTKPPSYAEDGTWWVPQFGGSSFLEFRKIDAYSAVTINMIFKTSDGEGVLLYNGQTEGVDFISLTVNNGFVEFRFNAGSGPLTLRSTVRVDDGEWHYLRSRRNRREGMLQVDGEEEVAGASPSKTTGVNLDTSLFLGGYPSSMEKRVISKTGVTKGLTGCIQELSIGKQEARDLRLDSRSDKLVNSLRVADCIRSPCMPNPCKNSSKCFITYKLQNYTFKCECSPEFYGETCQNLTIKNSCALSLCHEASICIENGDSYRCICPSSRSGVHCEELIPDEPSITPVQPSYMPMFAGDSFIKRPTLSGVSTRFDIEVVFYTFQLEGLIFYNAQSDSGKGDYVALNIRNGHLDFMYDLGEGAVHIVSKNKISLNEWHVAKLSRVQRVGDLTLDKNPIVKGESPNQHSQLNLGQPLYIGSVPDHITLPEDSSIALGFMGAIQKFVVNGYTFPRSLMNDESSSYHVQAFNGHPCFRNPCQNEGACIPELGNYKCNCKNGYSGTSCEYAEETLDDDSTEQDLQNALYFNGGVKALYDSVMNFSSRTNLFEFQFKTTATAGLIFYNGKSSRRGDYIALGLNQGVLHLIYDLGSGPSNVVLTTLVNDGLWRTVQIFRNENKASMLIDDNQPIVITGPPFAKWLNTDGKLWIGGCSHDHMPFRHRGVPKSFYSGFVGCIGQFRIDGRDLQLQQEVSNQPGFSLCHDR